ncbi:hypothetical protein DFH06DRAFT_1370091 [Mycena polygramma]|nr:hypothetical protein DFH06DRAFT_1370091 [Mycena polygramma]
MHFLGALLLCATGTLASKPQHQPHHPAPAAPRTHNTLAMRLRGPGNVTSGDMEVEKRDSYTGLAMTWYPTNTGPDACTGKNHKDSDWFVAMNYNQFGDGSACCGKQLKIDYNGKNTVATCVDECTSCDTWGSLDLTQGLFEFFVGDRRRSHDDDEHAEEDYHDTYEYTDADYAFDYQYDTYDDEQHAYYHV